MNQAPTIAHLSDLHLSSPAGARVGELMNKRVLSYLSWKRRRQSEYRPEILEAVLEDLHALAPDQIVVTGDLTQMGLPSECRQVRDWLGRLGSPELVRIIPGNHDACVRAPWAETVGLWGAWLGSPEGAASGPAGFPTLRVVGEIALIGISTARPTLPLLATGRVGRKQLQRLEETLVETGARGLLRVLLIHHPTGAGTVGWRKRLTDAAALRDLLGRTGVELVLHGHTHRAMTSWLCVPGGAIPMIGVPAASAIGSRPGRRAAYNVYRPERQGGGWALEIEVRGYQPDTARFDFVSRERLHLPAAVADRA